MPIRTSTLAGWCLFVLLLFLSAFYMVAGRLLSVPAEWGPRLSIALCEVVAFIGGAILLRVFARDKSLSKRLRPASRVYTSFSILISITTALGMFLLAVATAHLFRRPYIGIDAIYPMLTQSTAVPPALTILTLVVVPAIAQEIFLRGGVFSLYERRGTAAAVMMSAISLPLLYVAPSAAPYAVVIGLVCGLEAFYTKSVLPGILTHMLCRMALYAGDMLYASERFSGYSMYIVVAAAVMFLLFLFSLLRGTEGLLKDGLLEHFEKGARTAPENLWGCMKTSGFLLFFLLYIARLLIILINP